MLQVLAATTGSSNGTPFVLNDFWQKVSLAVLAAVLGFVCSYVLEPRKERREPTRRLTYDVEVRSGMSAIPSDLRDRIQVLYGGHERLFPTALWGRPSTIEYPSIP